MKEVPRVTHCVGPGGGGSTSVATMSGLFSPRNPTQKKRLTSVTVRALYEERRGRRSWNQLRTSDLQKNVIGCEREARDERRPRPAYWLEQKTSGVIHLYGTPVRASGKLPISKLSCGICGGTSPFGRRSFPVSHCTHLQHTPAPKRRVKKNTTIISDVGLLAHTSARRHADPLGFTPLFYSLASPLLKKRFLKAVWYISAWQLVM